MEPSRTTRKNFRIETHGFTVLELLVSMLLSSVLMLGVVQAFSLLTRESHDQKIRTLAQLQAQGVLDVMVPEIRMLGNGVPFHQANFLIAQQGLSDNTVTEPILAASTTAAHIDFRLNQTGETYILTADFDPASQNTVTLTGVSKIFTGDNLYITNSTVGADDGFYGVISAINTSTNVVTIAAGTQYSPGSTFKKGSLLEVAPIISYNSASAFGGITRDDGNGAVLLIAKGQFTLDFIDAQGAVMTLPLLASDADPFPASAIQNVRSVRITVEAKSDAISSSGVPFVATAIQSVGIRNLNFKY